MNHEFKLCYSYTTGRLTWCSLVQYYPSVFYQIVCYVVQSDLVISVIESCNSNPPSQPEVRETVIPLVR